MPTFNVKAVNRSGEPAESYHPAVRFSLTLQRFLCTSQQNGLSLWPATF